MEGVVDGSASDMSSEESVCPSCDDQCYFSLFDDVKETNLFTDIFVVSCSGDEGCASSQPPCFKTSSSLGRSFLKNADVRPEVPPPPYL